jgi:Flp pilus assembly protein TadG
MTPRSRAAADAGSRRGESGQAALEVAFGVPVLVLLLLAVVQVVVVARDQIAVVTAARAAARAAAAAGASAGDGVSAGRRSAGLDGVVVTVERGTRWVTATSRYRAPTRVPIVGLVVGDLELTASATLAVED